MNSSKFERNCICMRGWSSPALIQAQQLLRAQRDKMVSNKRHQNWFQPVWTLRDRVVGSRNKSSTGYLSSIVCMVKPVSTAAHNLYRNRHGVAAGSHICLNLTDNLIFSVAKTPITTIMHCFNLLGIFSTPLVQFYFSGREALFVKFLIR